MTLYKILALIPENNNQMVKLLNISKKKYLQNLKVLSGRAEIIFSGITTDNQDLREYQKLKKVI
jgi:hypothetical protein